MKLYIMRHGPAVDDAPSGLDADRDLTVSGRDRVRAVARALAADDELPANIVASPLARALQTAEMVAGLAEARNKVPNVSVRRELAPGGKLLALIQELRANRLRRVMVVGHEPDLTTLASALLGRPFERGFSKGMVLGLSLPDEPEASGSLVVGTAKIRFQVDPKAFPPQAKGGSGGGQVG
ncbi:MAG: phosphohistidine phosphatase SixA [Polyangiaceae bacterium]